MELLWMHVSPLCCSGVFWSLQSWAYELQTRAADREAGRKHISAAERPSWRRDRLTTLSLCKGLGQLPKEPQQAATAVGQIACSGRTGEDAQQTETAQGSLWVPFCMEPRPSSDLADGLQGWRMEGHLEDI